MCGEETEVMRYKLFPSPHGSVCFLPSTCVSCVGELAHRRSVRRPPGLLRDQSQGIDALPRQRPRAASEMSNGFLCVTPTGGDLVLPWGEPADSHRDPTGTSHI